MITSDEALRRLKQIPSSYRYTTLPCATDDNLLEVVAFVREATPPQRQELCRQIDAAVSYGLLAFAERMSMLCVRRHSVDLLRDGVIAVALMGPESDQQLIVVTTSLLYNSALKLDVAAETLFEQAFQYRNEFSSAGSDVLAFLNREGGARSIEVMGYKEVPGPSGLVYWAGNSPIPEGLLNSTALSESVLLEDLQPFFNSFFVDLSYSRHYEPAPGALDKLAPDERAVVEKKLLQALDAGSRESRVFLGLGNLAVKQAIPRLRELLSSAKDGHLVNVAVALWNLEKSPESVSRIVQVLEHGAQYSERKDAAFALKQFRCHESVQALKQALKDEHKYVRYEAALSLIAVYDLTPDKMDMGLVTSHLISNDAAKWQEVSDTINALTDRLTLPGCSTG